MASCANCGAKTSEGKSLLAGMRSAVARRRYEELGDAVYRGDEQGTKTAREQVKELDELAAEREAEMGTVVAQAHERLQQRRLEVQPTEMVELPEDPSPAPGEGNPPEPARIPEPYPPPDEGNPPQPAIIPEPSPAVIPEPSPAVIPEPGPQAPEGEERS